AGAVGRLRVGGELRAAAKAVLVALGVASRGVRPPRLAGEWHARAGPVPVRGDDARGLVANTGPRFDHAPVLDPGPQLGRVADGSGAGVGRGLSIAGVAIAQHQHLDLPIVLECVVDAPLLHEARGEAQEGLLVLDAVLTRGVGRLELEPYLAVIRAEPL